MPKAATVSKQTFHFVERIIKRIILSTKSNVALTGFCKLLRQRLQQGETTVSRRKTKRNQIRQKQACIGPL